MKNTLLQAARRQKGWSQQQLADFAEISPSTVGRAERGEPIRVDNIERLCACLQKTPEQLGLVNTGDQSVNRRQAIKAIGTAGASLVVGLSSSPTASQETDREIDRLIARKLTRLQHWVVDGFQDGTQLRWQLYYTSRNSLTDDGLLSQIARLEQLADDGGDHYQRVCRILAQNYQLAGSLARDRFQYTKSLEYFQKAE